MAIAPEQIGIGIRRHFTEPGEHPLTCEFAPTTAEVNVDRCECQ